MLEGQTCEYEGHQVALFPYPIVSVTQKSGQESSTHCCGNATDYAWTTGYDTAYAPFDCTLYNSAGSEQGNRRMYVSDNPIWTLEGLQYVSVSFTHDENPPTKTHFKQGEIIAHSGEAGRAWGKHFHMDQSFTPRDPLVYSGITCRGGNSCYSMSNSVDPTHVFYLTGDEPIQQTLGLEFQKWTDSPIHIGGKFKWWMCYHLFKQRRLKV